MARPRGALTSRNEGENRVLVFASANALDRTTTVHRGADQEWPASGQNCQAIVPANQAGVLARTKMKHQAMTNEGHPGVCCHRGKSDHP
jgi:hypothetical protein